VRVGWSSVRAGFYSPVMDSEVQMGRKSVIMAENAEHLFETNTDISSTQATNSQAVKDN